MHFTDKVALLNIRRPSKKYLVCVAQPTVFLDKKNTKIWVGESENSNITIFENFRIMSREKNCNKHLPLVQKIICQWIINFHLFLSIGSGHTIKPGTPEHGTTEHRIPAEQRNTPEQWWNNGTPRNTSRTPRNTKRTPK